MNAMRSLVIFPMLFFGGLLHSQPMTGNKYVRAELITDARDWSEPFSVGIRFIIEPGWYLYWKNPGDAGLPIQVWWELPEGWKATEVEYPAPKKFVYDSIIAYGYKREVILLATIIPSSEKSSGAIAARLDWLVCEESCVRGNAVVSLDRSSPAGIARGEAQKALDAFRGMMPGRLQESGVNFSKPVVRSVNGQTVVTVPFGGKNAKAVLDFFPETVGDVLIDFSSIRISPGELSMKIAVPPGKTEVTLKGLLVTEGQSYECTIPIELPRL